MISCWKPTALVAVQSSHTAPSWPLGCAVVTRAIACRRGSSLRSRYPGTVYWAERTWFDITLNLHVNLHEFISGASVFHNDWGGARGGVIDKRTLISFHVPPWKPASDLWRHKCIPWSYDTLFHWRQITLISKDIKARFAHPDSWENLTLKRRTIAMTTSSYS